jgi:hypothetical protein
MRLLLPSHRTSMKGLVRSVSVLLTMTAGALAHAGHYEVTYSGGGPVQIVGPSGIPWQSPYTCTTNPNGRGGGAFSHDAPSGGFMCNGFGQVVPDCRSSEHGNNATGSIHGFWIQICLIRSIHLVL